MRRTDPVELNKALGRKAAKLGFGLEIIQRCRHGDFPRHVGGMRVIRLRNLAVFLPIVGSYYLIFDFDQ